MGQSTVISIFWFQQTLHTDASGWGLDSALHWFQNGESTVLGYGNHLLVGAESKYHGPKLEFLVLKWYICENLSDCLYYADRFQLFRDYNPLVYRKATSKINATGQRWINELGNYNFTIHYKLDLENKVTDSLSRYQIEPSRQV